MKITIKQIFLIILLAITSLLCLAQFIASLSYLFRYVDRYYYFGLGIALYVILKKFVIKNDAFFQTFIHEFTHLIVGVFFGKKLKSFYAGSTDGGWIEYQGSSNIFVTLAPYCLPIFTYLLLIINLLFKDVHDWYGALIGFSITLHLYIFAKQIHLKQTDILKFGVVVSLLFIATFMLFNLALTIYSIENGTWWALKNTVLNIYYDILFVLGL